MPKAMTASPLAAVIEKHNPRCELEVNGGVDHKPPPARWPPAQMFW